MNRRKLVTGMLTLPLMGAVNGCKRDEENAPPSATSNEPLAALKVILHGPFAVVIDRDDKRVPIKAFVPANPEGQRNHELRFLSPLKVAGAENKTGKISGFHFSLSEKNLEPNPRRLRIDAGFNDFILPHTRPDWKWDPDSYFVSLELPTPDFITFFPPAYPVVFGNRPTLQPLNHVLEYRMRAPEKVRVQSPQLNDQSPIFCRELHEQYERYWKEAKPSKTEQQYSQRPSIEEELQQCSPADRCLFLGVGLSPDQMALDEAVHGINFFNDVLLPAVVSRPVRNLQKITSCTQAGDLMSSPMLMPANLRYPIPKPRLLEVASTVDCQAGGIIVKHP